jgi:hypothetical protein
VRRDGGPAQQLTVAENDVLYYPDGGMDSFEVSRDARGEVVELDFHAEDMEPARRELRVE